MQYSRLVWQVWSKLRLWSPCSWHWGFCSSLSCQYAGSRRDLKNCQCQGTLYLDCVSASNTWPFRRLSKRTGNHAPITPTRQGGRASPRSPPTSPWIVLTWQHSVWCNHLQKVWYSKWLVFYVPLSDRSFIKIRKSSGHRTQPCGVSLTTGILSEVALSMMTCWFMSLRNYLIQLYIGPLMS